MQIYAQGLVLVVYDYIDASYPNYTDSCFCILPNTDLLLKEFKVTEGFDLCDIT